MLKLSMGIAVCLMAAPHVEKLFPGSELNDKSPYWGVIGGAILASLIIAWLKAKVRGAPDSR